ncbi:alpha-amylase family protein [Allonocardiopsis opalescens]|uniref:Putative glycosyl hydrolase-like family 6 (GHL6) protein n=1 Tax=Allonocardiopsis opalescens TaxID=1144618 RepID=A0A2T0PYL2_9ACTN|nr:alpha-amylase family protein [Allonocardiopsis opalescens]PRX96620.1 putative glycosyl hydrolase-like family 6 (GHL6) protein [Allonocardiopsis opalescens]
MSADELWWRRPFQMFQTNLREIDAGLDVERVLDYLEDFGARAWLLSVGGIVSNYPTDLEFQTRNPALAERPSGDLVGDAVAAAGRRGIRVLARMDFSKVDHRRAERHPEWCFTGADGTQQVYNGLTSVCPSGDYYQHRLFEVVDEVLDRYAVDGFFFNWMSFNEVDYSKAHRGCCHCLACRRGFAAFAPGTELPAGPGSPGYPAWRRFTAGVLDELTARVRAHVSARRPAAPLILGDRADIVFHEANNAVGRTLWHHRTAEHVSAARTHRPDVPVLTNAVAFVDMPYRLAGEEPNHFAQYLVQAIARGANPSTYIMGTPDDVGYECLDVAGELTRFHRDHDAFYRDLAPAARVLLVRPDPLKLAPERLEEATGEFRGLYSALLEAHVPFDVLPEPRVPDVAAQGRLDGYGLVVLPDLGPLDPAAAAALGRFARGGGGVLATGASGFDGEGSQLDGSPVLRRTAVRDTVESVRSMHLRRPGRDGARPRGELPVVGAFHVVEPSPDAETDLPVLSRAPYGPPEKCHGHLPLDIPGALWRAHGAGQVAVLPWTPGRAYHQVGLSGHRDVFVEAALRTANGPVRVDTDLPEQVEVVLGGSAAGGVVHLINHSGEVPQGFRAPLPVHGRRLRVPWWSRQPSFALRSRTGLDPDGAGALPRLDLFEVLVERPPVADR